MRSISTNVAPTRASENLKSSSDVTLYSSLLPVPLFLLLLLLLLLLHAGNLMCGSSWRKEKEKEKEKNIFFQERDKNIKKNIKKKGEPLRTGSTNSLYEHIKKKQPQKNTRQIYISNKRKKKNKLQERKSQKKQLSTRTTI